ncbi:DUF3541 domain-containing protein [Aidingimonas lacisalsi]|uniref:DUF3541 domain-containing protein n=1 Tax=Aidingimonas lacisalsi TaxID=2604086 RepID=UPI0011D20720|nr:DUF3541 domain-containing protein [Aidingimonas lacisalsi]
MLARRVWWQCALWWAVMLGLTACTTPMVQDRSHVDIAQAIQAHYESGFDRLSPSKQRHYAQRMYRMTGDSAYLPVSRRYARQLLADLQREVDGLMSAGYATQRARELLAGYPQRTAKQRSRRQMFERWGELIYARKLLFWMSQAETYGVLECVEGHQRAFDYLADIDFRTFLTDPQVLEVYAAQVANAVYYLYQLGIADLRSEVIDAFRAHFPPERNAELDQASWRNKLYGMTHFVIAESRYYQRPVDAGRFDWLFEELRSDLDRVLTVKEDILAEVGISFLLTGQAEAPALARIREAVAEAYDPRARMIPGASGGLEFDRGEHRNVLAIMLFDWPETLHPGPDFSATMEGERCRLASPPTVIN